MQHQLQAHAAFFCQKTGHLHHGSGYERSCGFRQLRQRHHQYFAFHLARYTCFDLTRGVTDLEFGYRDSGWSVAQTANFDDLAANDSLVAVQFITGLCCQRGLFGVLGRRGGGPWLLLAHHGRRCCDRPIHFDREMTQYRVVELERMIQFIQRFLITFDIHQHIMRFMNLLDQIAELAAPPVFQAMNPAIPGSDDAAVALDHCGHLLALVGMDNESDFVMAHIFSLWVKPPVMRER